MTTSKTGSESSATRKKRTTNKERDGGGGSKPRAGKITTTKLDGGGVRVEREIGGRVLSLETGRMARQADGSVVARYGDTMILATCQGASALLST